MSSVHIVRKAGVHDTAFNHEIHNPVDEVPSEDSDDEVPETKYQYFEFSNGYYVMRIVRLILVIQVIALIIDHPSLRMAVMFDTFCRGIAKYSLQFHFRPFLDVIYVIEFFYEQIKKFLLSQNIPLHPTSVEIVMRRRLNVNPYLDDSEKPTTPPPSWSVDALNDRYFHTMKFYSQYIFTIFFVVMAVLFTVRFWEIHDYSNREEVKTWLQTYIADGWWRRGGLNIVVSITRALIALVLIIFLLYAIPNNLGGGSIPNALYLSTIFCVGMVIVAMITMIGFYFIRITEAAFTRYVSQNVAYTSAIILKRAVKAKIDIGLILLTSLFIPFVYYCIQAMLFFTDWNVTLVSPLRKHIYYFTPCYYMGFPPYDRNQIDPDSCAVEQYTSTEQTPNPNGSFYTRNILSCDSYWGIILFVTSAVIFTTGLIGYYYLFYSFISQARSEFINSRWVDILDKLLKIRDEELEDYRKRFPFWDRLYINASLTVAYQWKGVKISFFWIFGTMYNAGRFLFRITVGPVLMILSPVWFLFERLFIVSCLNFTFTSKEERARQQRKQRRGSLQLGGGSKSRRSKSGGGGGGGGGAGGSRANSAHGGDRSYSQHTLNTRPTSQRMTANAANAMMMRGVSSPSVDTAGGGGDGSLNSSGWPPMPTSPSSGGGDGGVDPNVIAFDQEFTTNTATTGDTNDFVSPFSPTRWLGSDYERRYSPSLYLKRWSHRVQAYLFKKIMSWSFVVYLRIQLSLLWHQWFAEQRKTEASGFTLTEVGGTHATWRRELTLAAKTRRLHMMRNHVINELRMTKEYFIADHELIISFCDYTIDSSGLMTLCIPYKYEYLWWYLVILFEMMWYAIFGATLRDYDVSWQTRCYLFLMIDILFGVVTFVVQPYTEELDRWLEYSGRVVIGVVAVGLPWYFSLGRTIIHTHTTTLYRPWEAMSFVPQLIGELVSSGGAGGVGAQFALWIDLFMVLAFFLYLLSIVESIGVFRTFDRLAKAMIFTYHDHILDFLVLKIDERTFGYENIFSGMLFIQQWDDILKLQRRYALLTWPDVRPATLVSWTAKCLEIKWASLFNLTIGNIRSSLGLTLLHIVMSAAESEIARWLIHTNPTLLTVQDSQNDNPITIALKECAYYLLVYGEQESGALDDGTSYSDEAYATYYPEIDDLRDEIYAHGEFIPELCTTIYLTSTDMVRLQTHGVYYEPDDPNHPDYYATHPGAAAAVAAASSASENVPSLKEYDALTRILLQDQEKLATLTALAAKPKAPDDVFRQLDDVRRAIKLTKRKQKTRQQKQQAERQALLMKRFPEDDVTDDFESGTIHAWTIMDFRMPEDYVSLDPKIMHMMARDPHYHYHGVVHEETAEQRSLLHQMFTLGAAPGGGGGGGGGGGVGANDYDDEGLPQLQQLQDQPQDETNAYPSSKDVEASANRPGSSHGELSGLFGSSGISGGGRGTRSGLFSGLGNLSALSRYIDRDLQYVVPSLKKVHYVDSMQLVPFTHPALKGFTDWDRPRRHQPNGGGGGGGGHGGGRRGSIGSERQSAGSSRRSFGTTTSTQRFQAFQSHAQTLDIRWKVCRFAEILMSAEIAQACAGMRWSVTDFKLFNKIASVNQGKIAQHLAMVCHLNPPPGFVRISDWSVPAEKDLFDEKPEEELPMMVKGIITVVSTVEKVAEKTHDVVETVVERVAEVPLDVAATLDPSKVLKAATKTFGLGAGGDDSSRRRYSFMSGGDSSAFSAKMRGRARRRRRKATTAVSYAAHESDRGGGRGGGGAQEDDDWHADGMLPDRVVHYLAEALVCSSHALALDDMEMSYNARRGWRAICRALRQRHASFVVPSLFSPPKKIVLHTLTLTRNELDCGDCVLLCDVLTKQRRLTHLDISFNRIGARGFARMCKALKDHEALTVLFAHHNQIGPGVGKDLGLLLKGTPALAVLDLSYNHLGEIIRYPTMITREKLTSAAHDVVIGLRLNKTLVSLDLSYNHLGPTLADSLAYAINRHPKLHTLHLSGNDLGPEAGPRLLFQLAGVPRGMAHAEEREAFIATLKERQKEKQLEDEEFKRNAARQRQQQLQPQLQPASASSAVVVGEGSMLLPPLPSTHPAAKNEGLMKMIQSELSMWESLEGAGSSLLGALGGAGAGGAGGSGAGGRPGDSREDKFDIFAGASFFSVGADDEDDDDDGGGGRGGGYLLAPLKSPSSPTKLAAAAAGGATAPTAASAKVSQRAKDDKVKQAMRVFSQGLDRAAKEQQNLEANAAGGGGEALTYAAMNLTALSLADNQLGILSGHAIASMLERMKNLTYLDVSGNSLGPIGGERVTDQLEYLQGIKPREFIKQVLWEIEESKYTGRNAKVRKKVFTNLTALNMSRNALGPKVMEALALCVGQANATLTALNVSDNPLGSSELHVAGLATPAATIIREGLAASRVLVDLQLGRSSWETTNLVTMLGGLAHTHATLLRLNFNDMHLDEPSCLQLGQAMEKCTALQFLSLRQCRMGSTGGLIVCQKVKTLVRHQLGYLDLNGNYVGPVSALYLSEAIKDDACQRLHTLYLADNDFLEEGGSAIARAMTYNTSITDLDLSHNQLTPQVAHYIAEFARGLFVNGVKVRETMLTRLLVNDNPDFGFHGARVLVKAVSNEKIQHLEMRNIGAGAKTAQLLSSGLRDPLIAWAFVDVRENHFTRFGLNQLFWAVRNNKRCRVLKVGANDAGPLWCTQQDALLRHGIAVPVAIRRNVVLRELDLSFNSLTSEAGVQILDALIDSHTLKKVNLRGNLLDDEIASMLPDLFRCNNVLEELDLGENRMAFACAFAIAESLEWNRSLRVLALDYNRFGGAGAATLDSFARSIMMNFSLQVLNLDGNKLGPEWGIQLAEVFARNNTLLQVSLRDNRLDTRAGQALLNAYRHAKYMLELALTGDEIGVVLWEEFRRVFEEKRANTDVRMVLREETQLSETQSHMLQGYEVSAIRERR